MPIVIDVFNAVFTGLFSDQRGIHRNVSEPVRPDGQEVGAVSCGQDHTATGERLLCLTRHCIII